MKAYLVGLLLSTSLLSAEAPAGGALPPPHRTGGKPVMEALALRSTSRSFDGARDLDRQQLSDLLWAAFGVNRPNGKRTAPSAMNWQETDIYVLMKSGAYRYDAARGSLLPVAAGDIRAFGGVQPFVKDAPVTLVYVADLARAGKGSAEQKRELVGLDVGFISENVYLFCASEGLATGARAYVDKAALGARLGLRSDQDIVLAQSVGYPK